MRNLQLINFNQTYQIYKNNKHLHDGTDQRP